MCVVCVKVDVWSLGIILLELYLVSGILNSGIRYIQTLSLSLTNCDYCTGHSCVSLPVN